MNGVNLFRDGVSLLNKYLLPVTDWKTLPSTFSVFDTTAKTIHSTNKNFFVWDWKNGESPLVIPLDNNNKPEFHYLQHFWTQYYPFLICGDDGYQIDERYVQAQFEPTIHSKSLFLGGRNHWGHSFIDYYARAHQSVCSDVKLRGINSLFINRESCPSFFVPMYTELELSPAYIFERLPNLQGYILTLRDVFVPLLASYFPYLKMHANNYLSKPQGTNRVLYITSYVECDNPRIKNHSEIKSFADLEASLS